MSLDRYFNKRITDLEKRICELETRLEEKVDKPPVLMAVLREGENENNHSCQSTQNQKQCKAQPAEARSDGENIQDK